MSQFSTLDLSHRICYIPNRALRLTAYGSVGRLRILFDGPDFVAWRGLWGSTVFFKRLEYRKLQSGVQHELILLRGLSKSKYSNGPCQSTVLPNLSGLTSSPATTNSNPTWWTNVPDNVYEYVLKFEREPSPEHQLNALVRTEAYDYVDFKEFAYLSSNERSSTVELAVELPEPVALEHIIRICSSISKHKHARYFTLRQYNSFFYCWSIVTILLQLLIDWAPSLESNTVAITQLLTTRLVALSDPQRVRSNATPEVRPSLALLLAGDYNGFLDSFQRPFIQAFRNEIIEQPSLLKNILRALQSSDRRASLWIRKDMEKVRSRVRELLDSLSESTVSMALEGVGESNFNHLFWQTERIEGLSSEWKDVIEMEVNRLLGMYLNSKWDASGEALKQTQVTEQKIEFVDLVTMNRRSNALQGKGNSPLMIGARMASMRFRAAWNAGRVRASLSPINSPLSPLVMFMRTLTDVPNQAKSVPSVPGNLASVLSMNRGTVLYKLAQTKAKDNKEKGRRQEEPEAQSGPQSKAEAQAQAPCPSSSPEARAPPGTPGTHNPLNLGKTNVPGKMTGIDLQLPELEYQVVCELEKSIKNLAQSRQCSMSELRLATLEMLIHLKETGKSINFGLPFERIWRIFLWYSLGEEIVKVLEEVAELGPGKRIQCCLQTSKSDTRENERPMLIAEIQNFIRGRVQSLSEMLHNQRGPGSTKKCQEQIEETMDTIWKGLVE